MLGSRVVNHRQHVGLQELWALAGVSHSSLGPYKRYKFIHDDDSGDSALACSCFRVIESLEPTCAVGQLVYETIQAHQKVHHTGSGCLLFLAGAWSRAALECLQRGMSVAHIVSAMSEGMDVCLDACRKCALSIEGLGVTPLEGFAEKRITGSSQALCGVQGAIRETVNTSEHRKIKLSRHFCETKSPRPKRLDIVHIAEGLSHGCDDAMKLVVKAVQMQSETNQADGSRPGFDLSEVVMCALAGLPEDRACVVFGCVVLLSAEPASLARRLQEQRLKFALINGDLSPTFRHLGFSRPAGVHRVSDPTDLWSSSREDEWVEDVVTRLLKLEVSLILLSGHACEKVIQLCCRHRVLVVENVKGSVLKAFANLTGAVPVMYATQLSELTVGTGATIAIWRDLSSHERTSLAVNISAGRNSRLVTAILTSCVRGKLQALEDRFWACAHRLHCALKDGAVLPGAGGTEMFCIHRLQKRVADHVMKLGETGSNHYRSVVLDLMAEGLIDYISSVMVNTGGISKVEARTVLSRRLQDCNRHPDTPAKSPQLLLDTEERGREVFTALKAAEARAVEVYDNVSVKQEAWRKALDLVFLVLQTDAEIITGTEQKTEITHENLMLL